MGKQILQLENSVSVIAKVICVAVLMAILSGSRLAAAEINVPIAYLEQRVERPPTLSNLDPIPEDLGLSGATLAINDNGTTGGFLGHKYRLESFLVDPGGDFKSAALEALAVSPFLVVNAPADQLLTLADMPEAANAVIFNASAQSDSLRNADCRANVLHTIPSHAMRADALAQFMKKKRWSKWVLVAGVGEDDSAFASALRRATAKFQLRIVEQKLWEYSADIRRNAAQEIPLYTQDFDDHDVLVVADERHDFGRYFQFHTWKPTLLAGSEGLRPLTWSSVVEQWGAVQLQNRFKDLTQRPMRSLDYAAWSAVRSIGEAVTRTSSNDATEIRAFVLSEKFSLGGHKGRPMSYRAWNGQLRQPIPLVHPRAVVAVAPIEGFLHQHSELDTLGLDRPESSCDAFDRE